MSTQNLSSVTIEIIGQYHQAGQRLARAYERGLQRAADAIGGQLTKFLEKRELPLVDADVKSSVIEAQRQASAILVGAVRANNERVAAANDRIAETATSGVCTLAGHAERIGTAFNSNAVDTLAQLGMPSAQLSLAVAKVVANGANRIGEGADDTAVETVDAEPTPKRAVRRRG
ncbi:MAG: hypothetical protein IPO66_15770 [Rhodanobacteraceae bacterium]|jgi:hypothetical protein|nr:hypothetical protein [Rhodanobacteraceae bacterium]